MTTLKEARDTIVSIANPDRVLRYCDDLMDLRRKQGPSFKLNAADAWLYPILEFYTEDLDGWVKFVCNVRNKLAPKEKGEPLSDEYVAVQHYFKVIQVRQIQRRTRAILEVATDIAVKRGLVDDIYVVKQRYHKFCIQTWKKRKDAMLDAVRRASPTGKVPLDHKSELLLEFWDKLASDVNNGDIPVP